MPPAKRRGRCRARHGCSFKRHERSFKRHGRSFKRRGCSFKRHGRSFKRHGRSFKRHGCSFNRHGCSFKRHGCSFKRHGCSFKRHGCSFERRGRCSKCRGCPRKREGTCIRHRSARASQHRPAPKTSTPDPFSSPKYQLPTPFLPRPSTPSLPRAARPQRMMCSMSPLPPGQAFGKKVFLSHKGADKSLVVDFKRTLELLGYEVWLDDDAMPAGTTVARGMLQGMKDSCAVVFFITPAFKDEGFLETEINYAVAEKLKKGEHFSIIILLLADEEGNRGEVPELLRSYVWKSPDTPLDALREVVRALPIVHRRLDWRDNPNEQAPLQIGVSPVMSLSEEASRILLAAASSSGRIEYVRTRGGLTIMAGEQQVINQCDDPREQARWDGGLQDLQEQNLILDVTGNGEVYKVTREGFDASDEWK